MTQPFSFYDARHYRTLDVVTGYEAWSATYDETVDSRLDLQLLESLGTVTWNQIERAADLACGTGRIGAWLRSRGIARVEGVDCCGAMLARAEDKRVYERLCQAELTRSGFPASSYGLVVTSLVACHLPDLAPLYEEAKRLLLADGIFVLLDYHPFFMVQGIPTHFQAGTGEKIAIENYVHFMSDHTETARRAGFSLLEMRERFVDESWIAAKPGMDRYRNWPVTFAMVWRNG